MNSLSTLLFMVALFIAATLYSSVGHAGASAYIAIMALFGVAPATMKPTALMLNIFVATITFIRFYRAGLFEFRLFWPFALTSVPMALLGGYFSLSGSWYKILVGIILLLASLRLFFQSIPNIEEEPLRLMNKFLASLFGAIIGLLSALTGTGGGIFLTPLLIFSRWSSSRVAAGVSAGFILLNSISGIVGYLLSGKSIPPQTFYWIPVVCLGGLLGSTLGTTKFSIIQVRKALAIVLLIAGLKIIFT